MLLRTLGVGFRLATHAFTILFLNALQAQSTKCKLQRTMCTARYEGEGEVPDALGDGGRHRPDPGASRGERMVGGGVVVS